LVVVINMASIGVPIPASFTANGNMTVEVYPEESFVWSAADFEAINGSMSASVFNNAFVLTEEADGSSVVELKVAMATDAAKVAAFKNAIASSLAGAAKAGDAQTLKAFLEAYAVGELQDDLASNGIPDPIEADAVKSTDLYRFTAALDCSDGAAALWTAMTDASAAARNIIVRQFPRTRFEAPLAEGAAPVMPGMAGDTVTFRFNISQSYDKVVLADGAATLVEGSSVKESGSNYLPNGLAISPVKTVNQRSVNLKITLMA
jgi:hypothetical protein